MPRTHALPNVTQPFLAVRLALGQNHLILRAYPEPRREPHPWFVRVGSYDPTSRPSFSCFSVLPPLPLRLFVEFLSSRKLSTLDINLSTPLPSSLATRHSPLATSLIPATAASFSPFPVLTS